MTQLRMRRWNLDDLPEADPRVRSAAAGDAESIARVLTAAFDVEWSEAKVREELIDHPNVPQVFVAALDGVVVATASYQLQRELPQAGWVHWVGADPAVAGRRLGRAVTLAALWAAKQDGKRDAGLTTDDARLPAIRTYLGLGFDPDPWDESHPGRWEEILARLHQPRTASEGA